MPWKKIVAVTAIIVAVVLLAVFWWASRFDVNRLKPIITQQVRSAIAREITIEGDIRLKIGLAPTLIAGPVKLRNADWGSRPDMLTVDEVELQIGLLALLSKKIVFKRLVLVKPDVWVEQKADGTQNNWQFDETPAEQPPSSPQTASQPYQVHLEAVEIQDGNLILHDLKTGETNRIQITTLTLDRQAGPLPLKIALEGGYNQAAIAVEGDISLFSDLLTTSKDWPFDLAIKGAQSELTLAGRLQRSSGDAPPRLEATVKGPKLDVRPWLSDAPEADRNVQKTNRVFPNTPLPFDILHDLELQADMDIQEFLMPHMALQNVKTPIHIKEGRLDLGPVRAIAGGGDYQAHLKIDARAKPPRVKATLKIDQMNAGSMLQELDLSNMIEGVVDFQADLEGQGASMAKLMSSLNGHAMLVSGEGQLGKLFFGLFDEGIASQLVTLFNPLEKRSTTTPIECLVIRFDSKGGVARLSQMIWVTPDSIVVGGGQIDLATEKIDIGIQPTPKQGKINLGILTKPFRLGGTLASPAMQIDPTATAMTVGRIAGGMLFGPIGIAVAFTSIGDATANPCLEAVKTAEKGVATEEKGFLKNIGDTLQFWK
jgi:uncharacterized protein involved in outer membrane biogenesis